MPTRLHFGAGVLERAGRVTASLGRRAFLVTSRSAVDRLGYTSRLMDDFSQHDIVVKQYCGTHSSPTLVDVDRGAAAARTHDADVVVALGGGSVIDCAKAIAGVVASERPAADFLYQRHKLRATPYRWSAYPQQPEREANSTALPSSPIPSDTSKMEFAAITCSRAMP